MAMPWNGVGPRLPVLFARVMLMIFAIAAATISGCADLPQSGTYGTTGGALDGRATASISGTMGPSALSKAVVAFEQAGELSQATLLAERIVKAQPQDARAWARLGELRRRTGNLEGARGAYERSASIQRDPDVEIALAQVALLQRSYVSAIQHFGTAAERAPRDARVWIGSGVAYDALGRHEKAQELYRHALALEPSNRAARNNLRQSIAVAAERDG